MSLYKALAVVWSLWCNKISSSFSKSHTMPANTLKAEVSEDNCQNSSVNETEKMASSQHLFSTRTAKKTPTTKRPEKLSKYPFKPQYQSCFCQAGGLEVCNFRSLEGPLEHADIWREFPHFSSTGLMRVTGCERTSCPTVIVWDWSVFTAGALYAETEGKRRKKSEDEVIWTRIPM